MRQTAQLGKLETCQENKMPACPNCDYTTPVAKRMAKHFDNTGHGRTAGKKKEYSSYYTNANKQGGGKKKGCGKKK